jgi:serine/threonine-protein kinase
MTSLRILQYRKSRMSTRFVSRGKLGRGGMATVQLVFDRNVLREVALKSLTAEVAQRSPEAANLLVEEAQIVGQLEHPNIVPVYDLVGGSDEPRLAMKVVRGDTLTRKIHVSPGQQRTTEQLRELLSAMLKVCDAVAYAHSRGVVHRDLKPDNIMVGTFGQVYVVDWGCAILLSEAQGLPPLDSDDASEAVRVSTTGTAAGSIRLRPRTVLGTGGYMAPEAAFARHSEIDCRTDVFSLGAILYQILTGQPPYTGKGLADTVLLAQKCQIQPPEEIAAHALPLGLRVITMTALSREPKDRYQTVQALKDDLERFLAGPWWFPLRTYEAGETIMLEGEAADAAYILTSGTCEVHRLEGNKRVVLRYMGPGDVFGETAILTNQPRSASVTTLERVTVQVITRESLENELEPESWVSALVRTLANRFREGEQRLARASRASNFERVIEAVKVHLRVAGKQVAPRTTEAPWARLRLALAGEMELEEHEVTMAVMGSAELSVDEERDVIRRIVG